jgi:hypothetical protein
MERCLEWAREMRNARSWPFRALRRSDPKVDAAAPGSVARVAVTSIGRHTAQTHLRALALVEELCAMTSAGAPTETAPAAARPAVTVGRT